MKKYIFFFFLLVSVNQVMNAQVKIGGDITTKADPSSVLELESSSKGLLIPRLTTAQVNSIAAPATGLIVFNADSNTLQVNVGTPISPKWVSVVVAQGTNNNGAVILPVGTDAQRPATPTVGMMRFNTQSGKFEGYNGTKWVELG